jgi:cyclohexanecarboxylate-CoA ligase
VAACPDKLALTAVQVEAARPSASPTASWPPWPTAWRWAWHRLGVVRNDIVACQLPNWWQFTVVYLACSRIGAVMNPLMHIFRERELSFMLKHGEAKVLIVPKVFRGFDYEADGHRACSPACRTCSTSSWWTAAAPTASKPCSAARPGRTSPMRATS